ncbi:MAG: hypothetical protein M3Z75_06525 [Actinomycetota bacterium]|nr:hypothetical protein [Actinomycetota bacterium]
MNSYLPATAPDIAPVLAAVLAASARPLTQVLERLSGRELRITVLSSGERALTDSEHYRLGGAAITRCRYRGGLLVTSDGTVAASTSLLWLPARLPADACRALDDGTQPAGRILAPYGMHRADRRALATTGIEDVTGADAAVRSTAVLVVGGMAAAIAEETITRAFAQSLAEEHP